jgi:GMP reductase
MRIDNEVKLDFKDVLIIPKRSTIKSRKDVDINRTFTFKNSKHSWTGLPIIVSNLDSTGVFPIALEMAKFKAITSLHKYYSVDELVKFFTQDGNDIWDYVFYTMGISDKDIEKLKEVKSKVEEISNTFFPKMLCIDVANGYTFNFENKVRQIRGICEKSTLMAGNVVSANMTEQLIQETGVDIVKIGTGSGYACRTRRMTAIGFPQFSAVVECSDAAHGLGGHICSDGGITCPGDFCRAWGGGSDFIMAGTFFAGSDECQGLWKYNDIGEKKSFIFYGMSSKEANDKYNGGLSDYKASEGASVEIEYKGPIVNVLQEVIGGIRSSCAYVGATRLKDFSKCCTFIRIS